MSNQSLFIIDFENLTENQIKKELREKIFDNVVEGFEDHKNAVEDLKSLIASKKTHLLSSLVSENSIEKLDSVIEDCYAKTKKYEEIKKHFWVMNFLGFIDYLCENNINIQMFYDKENCLPSFQGIFSEELEEFVDSDPMHNFSWIFSHTTDDMLSSNLLYFKNFDKDIKKIKQNFLFNITEEYFDESVEAYKTFKEKKNLDYLNKKQKNKLGNMAAL